MFLHPTNQYRATSVESATPLQLVVKLYQGAIRFTNEAMRAVDAHDVEGAHEAFLRAQSIVLELAGTLDLDAGELALQLLGLYDYTHRLLVQANLHKDVAPAQEAVGLLRELLSAWQALADGTSSPSEGMTPTGRELVGIR
ncbi:MAG: flagellar secretion chaperone FliS [Chloroflexota bacterium]|jgi:flagellar protein FliS|nr:flagellar secretion chaperone FliS [Chloroflexota bacterium]